MDYQPALSEAMAALPMLCLTFSIMFFCHDAAEIALLLLEVEGGCVFKGKQLKKITGEKLKTHCTTKCAG